MNDRDEMTHELDFSSLGFANTCEFCGGTLGEDGHPEEQWECAYNPDLGDFGSPEPLPLR
jgi:hypothetical protein